MATVPPSTLQFPKSNHPLFSPRSHAPPYFSFLTIRATTDSENSTEPETESSSSSDPDSFENRLSQVRLRYKSGTGKKAEQRKTKKGGGKKGPTGSGSSLYLPPVPLKEPVSGGLNVEFGFSPFSERVNGRIAIVGLTALLLVELATGKGVINYHTPAIVLIQVYFMAAASALFLKFEKEKVSVWPQSSPPPATTQD